MPLEKSPIRVLVQSNLSNEKQTMQFHGIDIYLHF